MPFRNPILAGDTLIRTSIQSQNWGPSGGTAGWSINADGTATFNSGTFPASATFGPPAWLRAPGEPCTLNPGDVNTSSIISSGINFITFMVAAINMAAGSSAVRYSVGSPATSANPTCSIGLYSVDAGDNGTLIAQTGNDATLFTNGGTFTRAWLAPSPPISAGERLAVGFLYNGTNSPFIPGFGYANVAEFRSVSPRLVGARAGQTSQQNFLVTDIGTTSNLALFAVLI